MAFLLTQTVVCRCIAKAHGRKTIDEVEVAGPPSGLWALNFYANAGFYLLANRFNLKRKKKAKKTLTVL